MGRVRRGQGTEVEGPWHFMAGWCNNTFYHKHKYQSIIKHTIPTKTIFEY